MPVEQLVQKVCDLKQGYTQFGGLRPFGVSFLFAGHDPHHELQLYASDPSGNYSGWKATCIGANNSTAQSLLRQDYRDDIGLEESVGLALKVLSKTMDSTSLDSEKRMFLPSSFVWSFVTDLTCEYQSNWLLSPSMKRLVYQFAKSSNLTRSMPVRRDLALSLSCTTILIDRYVDDSSREGRIGKEARGGSDRLCLRIDRNVESQVIANQLYSTNLTSRASCESERGAEGE